MTSQQPEDRTAPEDPRVVIIGPDGMATAGEGPDHDTDLDLHFLPGEERQQSVRNHLKQPT